MSHNDVIIMLMRCLDDLIRHVVIGWQVLDIAFTNRGVRRRRRNYFMGPGGGAHAPRALITSLSYLLDPAAENMEMCGEISFLRCICSYIIIMQYHTNRGCKVVDQVSMLDCHSSGSGFKSQTWLKFDSRFQPCVFPQASSAIMSTRSVGIEPGISVDWPDQTEKPPLVK